MTWGQAAALIAALAFVALVAFLTGAGASLRSLRRKRGNPDEE